MIKHYVRIILGGISAIVIYQLLRTYDFPVLKAVTFGKIVMLSGIAFIIFFIWVFYVKYILRAFSIQLSFKKTFSIFIITQIASRLRGALIGPLAIIYLRKRIADITYRKSLFISIIDSFIRFVTLIILSVIGTAIIFGGQYIGILLPIFGIAGLTLLVLIKRPSAILSFFMKTKTLRALSNIGTPLKKNLISIDVKSLIFAIAIYILTSFLCAVMFSIILRIFNYSYNIFLIWCINAMSLLIGIISLIPFGLGAQDLTGLWLLTTVGVDNNSALSCILLGRFFTMIIPVVTSVVLGIFFHWGAASSGNKTAK